MKLFIGKFHPRKNNLKHCDTNPLLGSLLTVDADYNPGSLPIYSCFLNHKSYSNLENV